MVEIVTGAGLGLERSSALLLGTAGGLGSANLGRAGNNVLVNAANGNLVIQNQDELLSGVGPNAAVNRSYNSLGAFTDDNGDNWASIGAQIVNVTGTVNTAGSTVQRIGWDGSVVTYSYDTSKGAYTVKEQSGAYDSLSFASGNWAWKEGSTGVIETYSAALGNRVVSQTDRDGNALSYSYTGTLLTKITNADGEYTTLSYSGNNLTQLVTSLSGGATLTRTRYAYDAQNRLTSVTVDLSPADNSVADGKTYVTSYSYVGTSDLIASIVQSDGSRLDMSYDASNRVSSVTQWVDATTSRSTTFAYDTVNSKTTVTDPQGNATVLAYDTNGNLLSVTTPPVIVGGNVQIMAYTYDAKGNVLSASLYDGQANATAGTALTRTGYSYDANGNLLVKEDLLGDTMSYTYDAANQLLTATSFTGVDPDGIAGVALPSGTALTTRYAYDSKEHLRFVMTPEGRVTEYRYNALGQRVAEIDYTVNTRDTSVYASNVAPSEADFMTWTAGLADKSTVMRTDTVYDFRGNVANVTHYAKADVSGNGLTTSDYTKTIYVYDQAGELLSRLTNNTAQAETFIYDGLGRVIGSTNLLNASTNINFADGASQTVVTLANGLVQTSVYDRAGELLSVATSGTGIVTSTVSYAYDALGHLRVQTDADGVKTYLVYDAEGRLTGSIDGNGVLTESVYDAASRVKVQIVYVNALSAAQIASLTDVNGKPTNITLASLRPAATPYDRYGWMVYDQASRLIETIDGLGDVVAYSYDGANRLIGTTQYATQLAAAQLTAFQSTPPTALALPAANATNDRSTRNFYSNDGLLIGVLDADGYLTQIDYDAAGRKSDTVRYATAATQSLWASGTFAQVQASITASGADQRNYTLYDDRGFAAATIDGEGNLTRFHYTARGDVDQIVRGQQVTPNTTYTLATLPAAAGGTLLETTNFTRNAAGQILTQVKVLAGSGTETTTYSYDIMGHLLSATTAENISTETRTSTNVYDLKGRLIVALSGEGSAALAALGGSPTQAQINTVYATYGTRYVYDAADRLIAKIDPDGVGTTGNQTLYYYDNNGRLRAQINALGEVSEYRYNPFGNQSDVVTYGTRFSAATLATLTGGLVTTGLTSALATLGSAADSLSHFDYNNAGELTKSTDPLGNQTTYGYDAFGSQTSRVTPVKAGVTVETDTVYNRRAEIIKSLLDTISLNLITQYAYDGFGRLSSVSDARGLVQSTGYDRNNRVIGQIDGLGQTSSLAYDARGNLVTATDRNGKVTSFAYDAFNRSVTTTTPEGVVSSVTRNAYGQTIKITDGAGRITTYTYDKNGHLKTVTNAAGITTNMYDTAGRLVDVIDAKGVDTHYTYDTANRVLTRVADYGSGKLNLTTTYAYDAKGEGISVTDATGIVTTYGYDNKGEKVKIVQDANGLKIETDYTYRADGKVTSQSDAVGTAVARTTSFAYDSIGRLTSKVEDAGGLNIATSYAYDADSNLIATTDALGRITRFVYDANNRLIFSVDAAGEVVQTNYDAEGRVISTRGYANTVAAATLTGFALAITSTQVTGAVATSTADHINRTYYDAEGRVGYNVDGEGFVTQNFYDGANNVIKTIRYYTAVAATASDTLASLAAKVAAIASATSDVTTLYAYDGANRLTDVTDGSGVVTHFVMDALGQITDTTVAYGTSDTATTHRVFDNLGRVVSETKGYGTAEASTTSYRYDALGHVTSMTDGDGWVHTNTYDALGRLTQTRVPVDGNSANDIVTSYQYDARGNRVAITDPRGFTGTFYYDNLDRLVLQVDPLGYATATSYSIGGNVASVTHYALAATNTGNAAVRPTITTSANDEVTSFTRDALNRVIGTTDAVGFIESYTLDAFGNRLTVTNKLGGITTNAYDRRGLLLSESLPESSTNASGVVVATTVTNTYTYDARGNRLTMVEASNIAGLARTTSYTYDKLDRLIAKTGDAVATLTQGTLQPVETYQYDTRGNLILVTDANGSKSLIYYDHLNRKIASVDALGTLTAFSYDANSNALTQRVYGAVLASLPATAGGTPPAPNNASNYRQTNFSYDRNNRLTGSSIATIFTGSWNGSSYVTTTANLTTSRVYDASGNVIQETDADGNSIFHYYDKVGHEIATLDQDGYLTSFIRDQDGNVLTETRFATKVTGAVTTATIPTTTADAVNDRITQFTYDKMGRRITETRLNVASASVSSTGVLTTATANAQISYSYNGLGEVTRKVEANGDTTDYGYDQAGRLLNTIGATITDYTGASVRHEADTFYDGLNNVTRTREGTQTANSAIDRITTYTYGTGGRLASTTDADGFVRSFDYDALGHVVRQNMIRNTSDLGTNTVDLRTVISYDALGRSTSETSSYLANGSWVSGDTQGVQYDAYGEVTAKLINGTMTEQYRYDAAGFVVQTNKGDGSWRTFVNDANGNATLTLSSNGVTDLSTLTVAQAVALATNNGANAIGAAAGNGALVTINAYTKRNQLVETREPLRDSVLEGTTAVTQNLIDHQKTYNAFGEVTSQTDARGFTTSFTYNTMGKITAQISPQVSITGENGAVSLVNPTQYNYYDLSGRLVGTRDANGNLNTRSLLAGTGHNGTDALTTAEYHPDTGIKQTAYDVFGDTRKITDEIGRVTLENYDKMDRLTQIINPSGYTVNYGYDGLGERVSEANSLLTNPIYGAPVTGYTFYYGYYGTYTTPYTYTPVIGYTPAVQTTAYDAQGRVISTKDFVGHQTNYSYAWNSSGLQGSTTGLGTYGGWTKTTTYVDAAKTSTDTTDAFGHEIAKTDLGGTVYTFGFDKLGRLSTQTSTAGQNMVYVYYNTGRVQLILDGSTAYSSLYGTRTSAGSAFTYDREGNRITSQYSSTNTTSYSYYGYYSYYFYSYSTTTVSENATATYDALNRITQITDPGDAASKRPSFTLTKAYDAVGNIRESKTTHQNIDSNQNLILVSGTSTIATSTDDYWYRYDSMNRFVTTKGVLSGVAGATGTTIVRGVSGTVYNTSTAAYVNAAGGVDIVYDKAGQRVSATSSSSGYAFSGYGAINTQDTQESYTYTADGYLASSSVATSTSIGGALSAPTLESTDTRDAMGRVTAHTEYMAGGTTVAYSRTAVYNNDSQVISDYVTSRQGSDTYTTSTSYDYGAAGGTYANGALVGQSAYTSKNNSYQYSSSITNTFRWYDSAQQSVITNRFYGNQTGTTYSTFGYDANGHVTNVNVTGQAARTLSYITDATGQVMSRTQVTNGSSTSPKQFYFYFNGVQIGQIGNNGDDNTSYAATIAQRTVVPGSGSFAGGTSSGVSSANFDENYQAINPTAGGEGGAASSYTVRTGDTLAGIAAAVWGDSSLWYVIAQANGIQSDSALAAGMVLTIPAKVENVHNTSSTFKVYDPNKALGDVQPGAPVPPPADDGCGVFGIIILAVIAIAVTVLTSGALAAAAGLGNGAIFGAGGSLAALGAGGAGVLGTVAIGAVAGAAGSIVSQGVGILTGIQKDFSWDAVGMAFIGGAVTAGLGPGGAFGAKGAFSSLGSVGGAIARGALGNAVTQGVGVATGLQQNFDWVGVAEAGIGAGIGSVASKGLGDIGIKGNGALSFGNIANRGLSNLIGGAVTSATRSLITGTDFGDNLNRALPSIIGSTIGSLVGDGISSRSSSSSRTPITQVTAAQGPINTGAIPDLATLVGPVDLGGGAPLSSQDAKAMETNAITASQTAAVANAAGDTSDAGGTSQAALSNAGSDSEIVVTAPSRSFIDPNGVKRLYLPTPPLASGPSAAFLKRQRHNLDAAGVAHDVYDGVDYVYMKKGADGEFIALKKYQLHQDDVVAVPQDYSRLSVAENRNRHFGDANYELDMIQKKNMPVIMPPIRDDHDRFDNPEFRSRSWNDRPQAIYWNPYINLATRNGYQSAALALIHEVGHAFEFSYHHDSEISRALDSTSFNSRYTNAEEHFEIRGIELRAARFFGEPVRDTHTGLSDPFRRSKSPISYVPWK